MVTVVCKVVQCPYISKNGFCRNRLLSITQNGQCGHIFREDGQTKPDWMMPVNQMFKQGYRPVEKQEERITENE